MTAMIIGLIVYLTYCLVALLVKLMFWVVYVLGIALYFTAKYGIKVFSYGYKFLSIIVSLIITQVVNSGEKGHVKDESFAT
jgi:hypothetical protein